MDEVTKYILQELKEIKAQQNQMYQMISDLIRIVGNTNAMLEETRPDVATLKTDVATLKTDVAEIKEWQYKTDERLERLENKFDRFERDQNENSFVLRDITYRVAKHETDIADLRRA